MRIRLTLLRLPTVTAILAFLLLAVASDSALGLTTNQRRSFDMRKFGEEEAETRRRAVGPGSSPPTCRSRCGSCAPCKPAHVTIQPGLSVPLEYYPEAWRCKCHNKLFMP